MIVEEKVIIILTEKDVRQIITSYLGSQGHKTLAENVEFNIKRTVIDDDTLGGPPIEKLSFDGCKATYSPPTKKKASILKS